MTPVGDSACSNPSNSSYASTIRVRGVYASTTRISTTLAAAQSSFLMTLERLNATALTLRYWPATTAYTAAATVVAAGTKVGRGAQGEQQALGRRVTSHCTFPLGSDEAPASTPARQAAAQLNMGAMLPHQSLALLLLPPAVVLRHRHRARRPGGVGARQPRLLPGWHL